jgi:hypothetical protein
MQIVFFSRKGFGDPAVIPPLPESGLQKET